MSSSSCLSCVGLDYNLDYFYLVIPVAIVLVAFDLPGFLASRPHSPRAPPSFLFLFPPSEGRWLPFPLPTAVAFPGLVVYKALSTP